MSILEVQALIPDAEPQEKVESKIVEVFVPKKETSEAEPFNFDDAFQRGVAKMKEMKDEKD